MIRIIQEEAPLEAAKLKTLVRGIRPRVEAKANPREGEPTDYAMSVTIRPKLESQFLDQGPVHLASFHPGAPYI